MSSATDTRPRSVLYCGVCSLPPEYCMYGAGGSRCKAWLEKEHPDVFEQMYGESSAKARLESLNISAETAEKLEQESLKAEKKAERKAEKEKEKKAQAKITIKTENRTKRKITTHIHGLEAFDIDLKKVAKFFASKFATGSSVSKNPQGLDEIVVQGDVAEEVIDLISDQAGPLKGASADQVVREDKRK